MLHADISSNFVVSVVIPVYNSTAFLRTAVESSLQLPEVGEVVLVDDGSKDNSFELARQLAKENPKVKSYQHEDGNNHGVSATRNAGIRKASMEFIAFLDADDYFLPGRFDEAKKLLTTDSSVDGVYDAAQYEEDYRANSNKLYTVTTKVAGDDLFYSLVRGTYGFFCTDSIVVRKSLFDRCGYFREDTRMHEDTELWLRMAYHGKLLGGCLTRPLSIIRRHEHNAIATRNLGHMLKLYENLIDYYKSRPLERREASAIIRGYWRTRSMTKKGWSRRIFFYFHFLKNSARLDQQFTIEPNT